MVIRNLLIGILLKCLVMDATQGQREDNIWLFGSSSINTQILGY